MKIRDEYKKKYVELKLTGSVPTHPSYLYEYELPEDFDEVIVTVDYENKLIDNKVYLNNENTLILASNVTPLILCYKPEGV